MKPLVLIGVVLVIVGIIALAIPGFTFFTTENVADAGFFKDEILPVSIPQRKGSAPIIVDRDEAIRADTTAEGLGHVARGRCDEHYRRWHVDPPDPLAKQGVGSHNQPQAGSAQQRHLVELGGQDERQPEAG